MPQYGSGTIVYRTARTRSTQRHVHSDEDCDRLTQVDDENVLEKPLPSFPEWVPRCPDCFQRDGTG